MKCALLGVVALSVLGIAGPLASADDLITPPGWYDGTGNPNGGFTVSNTNGVELGLRAKERQSPTVTTPVGNVYTENPGAEPGAPTYAYWNYEFSINLNPTNAGSGYLTLNDITASLTVTDDTTHTTNTVNALTYWSDDSGYDGSKNGAAANLTVDWGAQNSENPEFTDFPLAGVGGYTYNENASDDYTFTLTVDNNLTGAQLATDTIQVDVTPLPSAAWAGLALLGVCGASAMRKRLSATVA